jgi:hypothetical protein
MIRHMSAVLVFTDKTVFNDGMIREIVIWRVPEPVPPSNHGFKYRLFYGRTGERLIGYDNERGKGDHCHRGQTEELYEFHGWEGLIDDFFADVAALRGKR